MFVAIGDRVNLPELVLKRASFIEIRFLSTFMVNYEDIDMIVRILLELSVVYFCKNEI